MRLTPLLKLAPTVNPSERSNRIGGGFGRRDFILCLTDGENPGIMVRSERKWQLFANMFKIRFVIVHIFLKFSP